MPTSDVFKKIQDPTPRPVYTIKGGGICFSFSYSGLYDRKAEEEKAFERARNLGCFLFKSIYGEKPRLVIKPGDYRDATKEVQQWLSKAHPEMMSNNNYVPGIQTNVYG